MLAPLTRQSFEQVIPAIATGPQYAHYWGKPSDLLRRLLISVLALTLSWLLGKVLGEGWLTFDLILDIVTGLYWLWGPVYWAGLRNATYRRFPYSGFWRGRVLDVYLTEELVNEEERANTRGELIVLENRERRINIEIGDREGFRATVQAPVRRLYKSINPGQIAEMVVVSRDGDLSRIEKITDIYLPQVDLWIGAYPYLRRDIFRQISQELGGSRRSRAPRNPTKRIKRRLR